MNSPTVAPLSSRDRMLRALRFEQPDRPPHFETMFELEHEAFGRRFPPRTAWAGYTAGEKERAVGECMEIYALILERFSWDALAVYWPWSDPDGVRAARRAFGDGLFLGSIVGHSIWSIECITDWEEFACDLKERPDALHERARAMHARALFLIDRMAEAGADFVHLVNDIATNAGPFVSPAELREFMFPYLAEQVARIRQRGMFPFVHSDGNIMTVLDDYLALGAACFQSVDPMAGMDIAEVKRRCHGRMALMGNVQCSLLQEGPPEAIERSALYCLEHASPGGGYIFGTSNTIFPGMPLENYEIMLQTYRRFCARPVRPSP